MEPFREYLEHDALGLAELVRRKEVHPRELVEAAIQRIERLNPRLNAVIARLDGPATERASGPPPAGPFGGVPYLLKDMVAHAGTPLTLGSRFLKAAGFVPAFSHEVVARSERAGLIVVGKTNACEFGLLPLTEPEAYGPTANPWSLDHSPGGSSGGSAAAVAAGLVPMAHGNDGGGSIRIPAAACGVFGFKPSRGRNPGDVHELPDGLAVEHCLSRSVRDSAALLDATRGANRGDRWSAPAPSRPYLEELAHEPPALRIALATEDLHGRPAHQDCRAAVEDVATLCESLGHQVEPARPPIDAARFDEAFVALWASMAAAMFPMLLEEAKTKRWIGAAARALGDQALVGMLGRLLTRSLRPPVELWTRQFAAIGAGLSHGEHFLVAAELQRATYAMAEFLRSYDVLLTPVLSQPPVRTGAFAALGARELEEALMAYAAFTPICNVAGLPAMSMPLCRNSAGLPIGVQLIGSFHDESTLFSLAGQLERARPWKDRWPAIALEH